MRIAAFSWRRRAHCKVRNGSHLNSPRWICSFFSAWFRVTYCTAFPACPYNMQTLSELSRRLRTPSSQGGSSRSRTFLSFFPILLYAKDLLIVQTCLLLEPRSHDLMSRLNRPSVKPCFNHEASRCRLGAQFVQALSWRSTWRQPCAVQCSIANDEAAKVCV